MHCEDVIAPLRLQDGTMSTTMLLACSSVRRLASKTGLQDMSLALDLPRQQGLAKVLLEFTRKKSH